jgi:hypothetical protein
VYSAAFIFKPGTYDEDFHRLNALIDEAARATPGYIGAESWLSPDGRVRNATYYWESLVSEIVRSYGDGTIPHFTPDRRQV